MLGIGWDEAAIDSSVCGRLQEHSATLPHLPSSPDHCAAPGHPIVHGYIDTMGYI
jgi:hypothetical protein